MTDLEQTLEVGTLLIIETGQYSDRTWRGPVRMTRAAKKSELAAAYVAQWRPTDDGWRDEPDADGFLPWLVKEGYVEDVGDAHSWHVGSYGRFEP